MEFHVRTAPTIQFVLPTPDTTVGGAMFSLNGSTPAALVTQAPSGGTVSAALPYLANDGDGKVVWSFTVPGSGAHTATDHISVVTPYLSVTEIKALWPEASNTDAIRVEGAVRHIINAHCGQTFGYFVGTKTVEAHGESALRLPQRLIELTGLATLTANLEPLASIITSDGWYLKKGWSYITTPIENASLYWSGETLNEAEPGEPGYEKPGHGHIIVPPGTTTTPTSWRQDYPFKITGRWGYESVPAPVKEAASLLVNDYACQEAAYRDRYLESIKAADWRLQFSSRAWESTGNARADYLLSDYVILDWAII